MKSFIERNWQYLVLTLAIGLILLSQDNALAEGTIWDGKGGVLFEKAKTGVNTGFDQTRTVVYGVGGLGAIGLGALAFFGRFQWAWFFALVGGLSLIALVDAGITTLTGAQVGK